MVRTQQTPAKLNAEQLTVLEQLVEANNDPTLEELRYQLEKNRSSVGSLNGRQDTDKAEPKRQKNTAWVS